MYRSCGIILSKFNIVLLLFTVVIIKTGNRYTMEHLHSLELYVVTRTRRKEPIGTGSYANVYEVMVHGTRCAAKEMHPVLMCDMKKREFLTECVHCSRILHPNVVQFLGIYYPSPDAQLPWLVMELMHISLTSLIQKYLREDLPFHHKFSILMDTCQGIQYLHGQNIVHRDLSSNNILLTKHLVAKVSDLGVAKAIPSRGLHRHTKAPGTIAFMPPEALIDEPEYGLPMDVFSIGCVCIHLVSMKWPDPKHQVSAARTVLSEIERREHYLAEMIHYPALNMLTKYCLQDRPGDRPVIAEVIETLKNIGYTQRLSNDDDIIEMFKNLDQQILIMNRQLNQKDDMLLLQQKEIEKNQEILHQKDEMLRERHILLQQKEIEKNQELHQKDEMLRERSILLQQKEIEKNQELHLKDQELYSKDQLLKRKDEDFHQHLMQKDQEIAEKDQLIHELSQKLAMQENNQEPVQKQTKGIQLDVKLHYTLKILGIFI